MASLAAKPSVPESLDAVFAPELKGLDREQIRAWYNGHHWLGEKVYNPFDVLLLFKKRLFPPGGSRPERRPSW